MATTRPRGRAAGIAPQDARTGTVDGQMRAVVQDGYGSADVLRTAWLDVPVPGPHEVLVRVHAAGLDRGTWHLMAGRPYVVRLAVGLRAPRNPVIGMDLAGTVAAVGSAVTEFVVGEEVFGFGKGSFADYVLAAETKLARKPANLDFEQAAAVPVSAVTALQALSAGRVRTGQQVLIIGASGGVGSYAVQLAKAFGARVTGVASTTKLDLVRSLGADHVIDYTRDDFADGTRRYDLILDIAGNPALSRLRRALTPTGTAVIVGGENGGSWTGLGRQLRALALSPILKQRLTTFIAKQRSSDLKQLTDLIEAGKVAPAIDKIYPLDQAPEAMRHLEAGTARGKVSIRILGPGSDGTATP
jgi:NADPH:quinone reductase-like Zn-dependent oxidoreductase